MKYAAKRIATLLVTMVVVSFLAFLAFDLISGDPAEIMLGTQATPEALEALRQELGLNRPLLVRYGDWLLGFITGDLGISYQYYQPVGELLGVEEGGQSENGESPSPTRDWTDQDRAQVENIVVRYLRAAEQREHQGKRWLMLGACLEVALALIMAFVLIRAFDRMDGLSRDIGNLSSHINSVEHSISYQYWTYTKKGYQ